MLIYLFTITGCQLECQGVGCVEQYSSAQLRVFFGQKEIDIDKEFEFDDGLPNQQPYVPTEQPTVYGSRSERADWSLLVDEQELFIGTPADNSVRTLAIDAFDNTILSQLDAQRKIATHSRFGASLAKSKTPNGDSYLLIGAPLAEENEGTYQRGAIYVFPENNLLSAFRFYGTANGGKLGEQIFSCPDIDGDTWSDWLVAASYSDGSQDLEGRIFIGLSTIWRPLSDDQPDITLPSISGSTLGGRLGYSAQCQHDIDGDNIVDMLIGEPFADNDLEAQGAVYLFSSALVGSTTTRTLSPEQASKKLYGITDNSWLGWSITSGDIDGDGRVEVASGAPGSQAATGEVYLWTGEDLQNTSQLYARFRFIGPSQQSGFGRTVKIADYNGDGYQDLIAGAPKFNPLIDSEEGYDAGAIYIYSGATHFQDWRPIQYVDQADHIIAGDQSYMRTGQLIYSHDINSDGADDLLLVLRQPNMTP